MTDITVEQLNNMLHKKVDFTLVDVREPEEHAVYNIGGILIPLGQLPDRLEEIPRDKLTVVYCRSGGRSAHAVQFLQGMGFLDVHNLAGGMLAWVDCIDSGE